MPSGIWNSAMHTKSGPASFSGIKKAVVGLLRNAGRLNPSFIVPFELNIDKLRSSKLRIVTLQESSESSLSIFSMPVLVKRACSLQLFELNNSASRMVKQGSKRKPAHDAL